MLNKSYFGFIDFSVFDSESTPIQLCINSETPLYG